jgi:hypothetical protein
MGLVRWSWELWRCSHIEKLNANGVNVVEVVV